MADFILRAGIEFEPTDATRRSLRRTIAASASNLEVSIASAKLSTSALSGLKNQVSAQAFSIGRIGLSSTAIRRLKEQILSIPLTIGNLRFAPNALRQLAAESNAAVRNVRPAPTRRERAPGGFDTGDTTRGLTAISRQLTDVRAKFLSLLQAQTTLTGQATNLRALTAQFREMATGAAAIPPQLLKSISSIERLSVGTRRVTTNVTVASQRFAELRAQIAGSVGGTVGENFLRLGRSVSAATTRLGELRSQLAGVDRSAVATVANMDRLASAINRTAAGGALLSRSVTSQVTTLRNLRSGATDAARAQELIRRQNDAAKRSFDQLGISAEGFGQRIVTITARFAAYLVSIRAILAVQQAFRESLDAIVEFDDVLQDLSKVVPGTRQNLEELSDGIFDIARRTGASIDEVAISLNTFVRQVGGRDISGALKNAEAAITAVNISELSAAEATKFITASLKIFGNEIGTAERALDILSITADNAATTAGEVGRAFIRSAAAAETTGVSFRELTALITSTIDVTQEAGARVGTALKTIFTRIRNNTNAFRDQANALGANITANDSVFEVIQKLSRIFPELNRTQRTQLSTTVAGIRQFSIFSGLVNSVGKAQDLLGKQTGAAGTAAAKQRLEVAKLSTQTDILGTSFKEFVVALTGADEGADSVGNVRQSLAGLLQSLTTIVEGTTSFVKTLRDASIAGIDLSSVFTGIGKAAFFVGGVALVRGIFRGISQAVGATSQLTTQLGGVSTSLARIAGTTEEIKRDELATLQIEERRLSVLQRILNTSLRIAGTPVTGGRAAGGVRDTRGTRIALGAGAAIGIQLISDELVKTADSLRQAQGAAATFQASVLDTSASALSLGTTLGLITGNLRVGLAAAAISATLGITKFALSAESTAEEILDLVEKEARARTTGEQAIKSGSESLRRVFEEEAERTGQAIEGVRLQTQVALSRAADIIQTGSEGVAEVLERAGVELEIATKELARALRTADLERDVRRAGSPFRARTRAAEAVASGGVLADNFGEIDAAIASAVGAAESLVGPLSNSAEAAATLVRAAEAFKSVTEDTGISSGAVLKDFQLQSPELLKLESKILDINSALDEQIGKAEGVRKEIEALTSAEQEIKLRIDQANIAAITEAANQQIQDEIASDQGFAFGGDPAKLEEARKKLIEIGVAEANRATSTEELNAALSKAGVNNDRLQGTTEAIESLQQNIAAIEERRNGLRQSLTRLEETEARLTGQQAEAQKRVADQEERLLRDVKSAVIERQKLVELARALEAETRAEITQIEDQTEDARARAALESQINALRRDGVSIQDRITEANARATFEVQDRIRIEERAQGRAIQRLRDEAEARQSVDTAGAAELTSAADNLQKAFEQRRGALSTSIQAEVSIELERSLTDIVREQEEALSNFRIQQVQRAIEEEQTASDRRIALIQRAGSGEFGRQLLANIFDDVPERARRQFGNVGALVVREQEDALSNFAQGVEQEFSLLEEAGVTSIEKLRRAEELRAEILDRNREVLDTRRERSIDQLKSASDRAEESEKNLASAREQIPAANEAVIEAQRGLASAAESATDAQQDLARAQQSASDATAELRFNTLLSVFQIKQQTGAFSSIGAQFGELRRVFQTVTREIAVSETQRLQLARQISQEQLNLLQQQFNSLQSLGARAATATTDELAKLQRAVGAAAAIASGADVGQFQAETLQQVAGLGDLFPGLQRALAEFGLEQLGLDPNTLDNIEDEMVQLARLTAETGRDQLISANEQVRVAQEQLLESQADRSLAEDQLSVAEAQREAALQSVTVGQVNAATTQAGFQRQFGLTQGIIRSTQSNVAATKQVDSTLKQIAGILQNQAATIASAVASATSAALAGGGGGGLGAALTTGGGDAASEITNALKEGGKGAVDAFIDSQSDGSDALADAAIALNEAIRESTGANILGIDRVRTEFDDFIDRILRDARAGSTGNFASGSLTNGEIGSMVAAARREKRAMPPGARLMLANTSETVLTRRQARVMGMRPIPKLNAQEGNAAFDATGLQQTANLLNTAVNTLITRLNEPGFVQQNFTVEVDSARTLNVRGVEAFDAVVRQTLQDRLGGQTSREEVEAVAASLSGLVQRLNEEGIVTSQGT